MPLIIPRTGRLQLSFLPSSESYYTFEVDIELNSSHVRVTPPNIYAWDVVAGQEYKIWLYEYHPGVSGVQAILDSDDSLHCSILVRPTFWRYYWDDTGEDNDYNDLVMDIEYISYVTRMKVLFP